MRPLTLSPSCHSPRRCGLRFGVGATRALLCAILLAALLGASCSGPTPPSTEVVPSAEPAALPAADPPARGVEVLADQPYASSENPRQRLDLFRPRSSGSASCPVVVYFHSGGWVSGDRSEGARHLEPLVAGGRFAGVSAGYRLADEAIWPAQIHDVKAAIRWVRANADRYGLDRDRIAVWGRSAGGHLALMAGLAGDDPAFEGELGPHAGTSTAVAAVVNHHGITELLAIEGQPVDRSRVGPRSFEARLIGGPLHQHLARAREASPVTHASPGDPPVLTLHGTRDRTVPYDQALRLDRALSRAGVPHTLVTIPDGGHDALSGESERRVRRFLVEILDPGVPLSRP